MKSLQWLWLGIGLCLMAVLLKLVWMVAPDVIGGAQAREERRRVRFEAQVRRAVGLSPEAAREAFGKPKEVKKATLPKAPFFGPQEALSALLKPGQAYEEWRYEGKKGAACLWFADPTGAEPDSARWKVVATGVHWEGTVY